MKRIEDTILRLIKAGDKFCLAHCGAHAYMVIPEGEGGRGGLAFSVITDPEPHMIHISLNLTDDYDVCLTQLARNGKVVTKESGTCQGRELAEVIISMCNRVVTVQQVESMNTSDVATVIMQVIHAEDPWCLANCAASHFARLDSNENHLGGVAFRVKVRPGQIHTITIQLTPGLAEYDVVLTRFYLGASQLNVTQRIETAICPPEALAEVITRMCK